MAAMSTPLGVRIRALRKQEGFVSIEAFAHALGYSWPTVSRYERGVTTPSLDRLRHIADTLNVRLERLLDEDEVESHSGRAPDKEEAAA